MCDNNDFNKNNDDNSLITSDLTNQNSDKESVLNQENQEFCYEWGNNEQQVITKPNKRKSNKSTKLILALAITLVLVSSMLVLTLIAQNDKPIVGDNSVNNSYSNSIIENNSEVSYAETIKTQTPSNDGLTLSELYESVSPGCCTILSTFTSGSGWSQTSGTSIGSGFVITEEGYVVTNHHVIENSTKIEVVFYDDSKYEAELVGSDSICDIAVLKIEGNFSPVELGDSDACKVGEFVCAIGTPSGIQFAGTLTYGCISAINRDVQITNTSGTVIKTMTLIQTDATLNPGNSGGPLFNMYGQVVGINTLKLTSQYEGIGFSIPISGAKDIINQIIEFGYVIENNGTVGQGAPYLGITPSDISKEDSEYYGVPMGVLVYQIESSNSSYKAGLRRGDIIVEFCGEEVKNSNDLKDILGTKKAGENIKIKVYRDSVNGGEYIEIEFKLDSRK